MGKKGFVGAVKGKNDDIRKLVEGEVPDVPKEVKEELVKKLAEDNSEVDNKGTRKTFWGSWDDYEKVAVKVNGQEHTYAKVGDRLYSKHAVDRMQPSANRYGHSITQAGGDYGRSVAPQYVEDVINSVKPIVQENGNLKYIGGSLEVITNPQGAVVTIMTK